MKSISPAETRGVSVTCLSRPRIASRHIFDDVLYLFIHELDPNNLIGVERIGVCVATCTAPYPRLGQERKPNHNLGSREAPPRSETVGTKRSGGGQESIIATWTLATTSTCQVHWLLEPPLPMLFVLVLLLSVVEPLREVLLGAARSAGTRRGI